MINNHSEIELLHSFKLDRETFLYLFNQQQTTTQFASHKCLYRTRSSHEPKITNATAAKQFYR